MLFGVTQLHFINVHSFISIVSAVSTVSPGPKESIGGGGEGGLGLS